jgi:hypothetical protein
MEQYNCVFCARFFAIFSVLHRDHPLSQLSLSLESGNQATTLQPQMTLPVFFWTLLEEVWGVMSLPLRGLRLQIHSQFAE